MLHAREKKNPKAEYIFLIEKQSIASANKPRWCFICNQISFVCDSASTLIFPPLLQSEGVCEYCLDISLPSLL